MFVYHSKDSTAVANYVSRYYQDDLNQNVLMTKDLNRQQWEENGFIITQELPYTLGQSPSQKRGSRTKEHRSHQWVGGKATSESKSSSSNSKHRREGRRLSINGIIDGNLPVGIGGHRPRETDSKSRTISTMSDGMMDHAYGPVFDHSILDKHYAYEYSRSLFQPGLHGHNVDVADVYPVVYDGVEKTLEGDMVMISESYMQTKSNGINNSAYDSTGEEFVTTQKHEAPEKMEREDSNTAMNSGFWFWYSKFIARFPVLFCVIIFLLTVAAGAVSFTIYDLPQFDDPEKGFESRHTLIRDRLTGLELFNRITDDINFHTIHHDRQSKRSVLDNTTSTTTSNMTTPSDMTTPRTEDRIDGDEPVYACVVPGSDWRNLRIVFSVVNSRTSLFSVEAFHSICRLYDKHVYSNETGVPADCHPASLGQYAALLEEKHSCYDTNEDDASNLLNLLTECAPHYVSGTLLPDCTSSSCPKVPRRCTTLNAAYYIFHYLLPSESAAKLASGDRDISFTMMITPISGYASSTGRWYVDRIQGRNDMRDDVMKISAVGGQFKFDLFAQFLMSDIVLVGLAVGVIMFIIWLYTGSLFITLMTLVDMVMALVMSYFVYMVVIGLPFFPFVNILAVILVLGIGADDTFVFIDLWRQIGEKYQDREENRVRILQETLRHAAITMFVTSFTTSSALFFSITSSITGIKCFAVYSGCAILFNFFFTLTWLPAIVIIEERYLRCRKCRNHESSQCSSLKPITQALKNVSRYVFQKVLPKIVFKLRYVWLILFTLLGIGGGCAIFVYPKLELPTQSQFQIFVKSDFVEQYDQEYVDYFDFEQLVQSKMPINFVWGLESKDNGNSWDPDDRGSLVLDNGFNISAPESQVWLLNFCADVKNQSFYSPQSTMPDFCFMDSFKTLMMESPCDSPVYFRDLSPCCENYDFPYDPELFQQCASMFVSLGGLEQITRFGEGEKLTGLLLSFTSNTRYSLNYESIDAFWSEINRWSKQEMDKAPETISHGWFVSFSDNQLYFFDLQQSLVTGFPFSIGLSLGVAALVLLLTTWNVLLTLYAILSISGTVFVTVGSLVFIGWELNILESTIMSLAVGLSVDFTIHYGVAYRIAPTGDRVSKSVHAMRQLTSAISTAALSTFVAGVCMLPATVLSYQQIGVFLALVMGVSWAYGTFFFMSLCMIFGPEKNCSGCSSRSSNCCCGCSKRSKPVEYTEKRRYASDFHTMYAH